MQQVMQKTGRVAQQKKGQSKEAFVLSVLVSGMLSIGVMTQSRAESLAPLQAKVDAAVTPIMQQDGIPGMAIGVIRGDQTAVYTYGLASVEAKTPVTQDTLFELGSISKTFTATLTSLAELKHQLKLTDPVEHYLPELAGHPFGKVTLLQLGTHTPGGLPLQVPDQIHTIPELMQYLKDWQPSYAPDTTRTYANPGIGTLGLITARAMGQDFDTLMVQRVFTPLGLTHSYLHVPADQMANYAQGYSKTNQPVRMTGDVLSFASYGITSNVTDMLHFLQANMQQVKLEPGLAEAMRKTHTGYYQTRLMTQDLMWEQYPYPVSLDTLISGNSPHMLEPQPVTVIRPAMAPRTDVWINKTGSTNGFGAYVAYVPKLKIGIVMLANHNFPMEDRVRLVYQIFNALHTPEPVDLPTKLAGKAVEK